MHLNPQYKERERVRTSIEWLLHVSVQHWAVGGRHWLIRARAVHVESGYANLSDSEVKKCGNTYRFSVDGIFLRRSDYCWRIRVPSARCWSVRWPPSSTSSEWSWWLAMGLQASSAVAFAAPGIFAASAFDAMTSNVSWCLCESSHPSPAIVEPKLQWLPSPFPRKSFSLKRTKWRWD